MKSVKEVIEKKNDLVMQMAFSTDINEVRVLMKLVRTMEDKIQTMTVK